jgi:hypothetical protein
MGGNALFQRFFADFFRQPQRIYPVDQICFIYDILYFVSLQMPYHMPFNIFGQLFIFIHQLLNFIFSKMPASALVRFHQSRNRFGFADCDQSDFLWIASCFLAGRADIVFHMAYVFCDRIHGSPPFNESVHLR